MGHGSLVRGGDPALEGLADLVNSAICRISALDAVSPLYLLCVVVWADCCFSGRMSSQRATKLHAHLYARQPCQSWRNLWKVTL